MDDQPQQTQAERYITHRAANTELKRLMDEIYGRLDVVGTTLDVTDPKVVTIAQSVIRDLEDLREQANQLRATRDYIYYAPGGGSHIDDAIDWLNGQVQGAHNVIAMRNHKVSARRARLIRDEAQVALIDVGHRITQILAAGRLQHARYEAIDSSSREGLELAAEAYRLMRSLADARDEQTLLRVAAGELGEGQLPARLAETAEIRATADAELAATVARLQ